MSPPPSPLLRSIPIALPPMELATGLPEPKPDAAAVSEGGPPIPAAQKLEALAKALTELRGVHADDPESLAHIEALRSNALKRASAVRAKQNGSPASPGAR